MQSHEERNRNLIASGVYTPDMQARAKNHADHFVKSNIQNPNRQDFFMIENAILLGMMIATASCLEEKLFGNDIVEICEFCNEDIDDDGICGCADEDDSDDGEDEIEDCAECGEELDGIGLCNNDRCVLNREMCDGCGEATDECECDEEDDEEDLD